MFTNKRQRSLTTKTKEKTWISKISMTNKVISCILIYGTAVKVNCSALVQEYGECRHVSSEHRNANEKQDLHNTSVNANTLSTQEQKTGGAEEVQLYNDSQMLCNIMYKYVSNKEGVTVQEILGLLNKIAEQQKRAIINTKVLSNIASALWNIMSPYNKDTEGRKEIAQELIGILNKNKDKINEEVLKNINYVLLVLLSPDNSTEDGKEISRGLIGILTDKQKLLNKDACMYLCSVILNLLEQDITNDDIRQLMQDIVALLTKPECLPKVNDDNVFGLLRYVINEINDNIENNKHNNELEQAQKEMQNIINSIQKIITAGEEQNKQQQQDKYEQE